MISPALIAIDVSAALRAALKRFWETCEDGEGYDVPQEQMKSLARLGLIRSLGFSRYEFTNAGDALIEQLRSAQGDRGTREAFESAHQVPDGVFWSAEHQAYRSMNGRDLEQEKAYDTTVLYSGWKLASTTQAPGAGHWYSGDDIDRLVKELDVLLNGQAGAAPQARLADVVAQVRRSADRAAALAGQLQGIGGQHG